MTTIGYVVIALCLGGAALASWAIDELAQRYATKKAQQIFRDLLTNEHERTLQTIRRSQHVRKPPLTSDQIVERGENHDDKHLPTRREREE